MMRRVFESGNTHMYIHIYIYIYIYIMSWQSEYICVAMKEKMQVSDTFTSWLSLLFSELSAQKTVWSADSLKED